MLQGTSCTASPRQALRLPPPLVGEVLQSVIMPMIMRHVTQRLQHLFRARGIADRQHMARAVGGQRIAVPVAHPSARALDHRHQGSEVVQLQPRFANDVDMAARQQPKL